MEETTINKREREKREKRMIILFYRNLEEDKLKTTLKTNQF